MNYGNGGYGYQQYPSYAGGPGYSQGQQNISNITCTYGYSDAGVEAYPVAPGNTVIFLHVTDPIMWIKTVDVNGRPLPIKSYNLYERDMGYSQAPQIASQPQVNMNEYVKKTEIEGMVTDIMNKSGMSRNPMPNSMQGQNPSYQQMPVNSNQNWSQEVQ